MAEWIEKVRIVIRRSQVQFPPYLFVLSSPEFKSSTMLVNSQLVCLWPVEILDLVGHNGNYWFLSKL